MTYKMIQVGTGGFGKFWCKEFLPPSIEEGLIDVVAAVDIDPKKLKNARKFLDLASDECYTDVQAAFEENEADFCTIVVTPSSHEEIVDLALEHDMHILSEKPISDTLAGSIRIVNKIKQTEKKMGITFSHRFDQDKTTLRREIKAGDHGKLDYVVGRLTCDARNYGDWGEWRHNIANPLMIEGAMHHLDYIVDLAEAKCDTVYANTWTPPWGEYSGPCQGLVQMNFKNDVYGFYEGAKANAAGLNCWGREYFRAECKNSTLILDNREIEVFDYNPKEKHIKQKGEGQKIPLMKREKWSHPWLIEKFVNWLSGGNPMETNVKDSLQSMAVTSAAIKSGKTGKPVKVQDLLSETKENMQI